MEEESKNLLPTVDVPDFVDEEEDEEYDVDYKPSPMWDLEKGDFAVSYTHLTLPTIA